MKIRYPTSDKARKDFLLLAKEADADFRSGGTPHLPADLAAGLASQHTAFAAAETAIEEATIGVRTHAAAVHAALPLVQNQLRSAWNWAKEQIDWYDGPALLRSYYDLPQQGPNPRPSGRSGWASRAEKVLQGIDASIAAGLAATPNHAKLADAHQALAGALLAQESALRVQVEARKALQDIRQQVDELIRDVLVTLRMGLRKEEKSYQRQVMRRYGAQFVSTGTGEKTGSAQERALPLTPLQSEREIAQEEKPASVAETQAESTPVEMLPVPTLPAMPVTNGVSHD